jgi:tetratricopeptide (TPR) repeat protein
MTVLGWWAALTVAVAQDDAADRAADLFANGAVLYDEGSYEASILAFQEALALSGRSELHYNIANCLERLGRLEEAYNELNLYRAVAPPEERETLDRRLTSIRTRIENQKAAERVTPTHASLPRPSAPPPGPPRVDTNVGTWTLLGAGGAIGTASLVGLGGSYVASRKHLNDHDPEAYASARTWNAVSWLGLVGGAGLAIGGVLTSEVTLAAGPRTIRLNVRF